VNKKTDIYYIGIDIGSSYIKGALLRGSDDSVIVDKRVVKIRKGDPSVITNNLLETIVSDNRLNFDDIGYIASTGEGEMLKQKMGHFFSLTTHAMGGAFLNPGAKTIIDLGAFYIKAINIDYRGKVLDYKMTGQCASGSGQFVENISRYLGLSVDELGEISMKSKKPEMPSGICAVLAETDVSNDIHLIIIISFSCATSI